jgi:predicted RNase H-like HicB family nuclease
MARGLILVKAAHDADAAVWFVEFYDPEGVNAEAPSLEELLRKLPRVILDLLEEEGRRGADRARGACHHTGAAGQRGLKGYGRAVRKS